MKNDLIKKVDNTNNNFSVNKDVYHAIPNDSEIYSVVNSSSNEDYNTQYKYVSREGHKLNTEDIKVEELVLDADDIS